jgi:RHS repeat-associated protein
MAYDAEGRLRQTVITAPNVTTRNQLYDGVNLVADYDGADVMMRRYVHGPGVDEPLVIYEGAGTTIKNWQYADHLGSIIGTADGTGTSTAIFTYGPFGESSLTTGQRYGYTGQRSMAALGLLYYKARFYSPSLGRFLQPDPIGYADDLNLYAYVGNNPVNATDPDGADAVSAIIKLGGRLGSKETRDHVIQVAQEWVNQGWTLLSGGGRPEKLIPGAGGGAKGGAYGDAVLEKGGQIKIINTADTNASGAFTSREIANGERIQALRPEADFSMVAKPKSQRGGVALEFLVDLLIPIPLAPTTLSAGTLYGPGTAFKDSNAYDQSIGGRLTQSTGVRSGAVK